MKLAYNQDHILSQMAFVYEIPRLLELLLGDQPETSSLDVSMQRESNRVITHYEFDTGDRVERVFLLVDLNDSSKPRPTPYKVEFVSEASDPFHLIVGGNFWYAGAPAQNVAAAIARAIAHFFVEKSFPDPEVMARRAMINYATTRNIIH